MLKTRRVVINADGNYVGVYGQGDGNWCYNAEALTTILRGKCLTVAKGVASHSEGVDTQATGDWSHSAGYNTIASGKTSSTEGESTQAQAEASHAGGIGTIAKETAQTVIGKYNADNSQALFIIGNGEGDVEGTSYFRQNAFWVTKGGGVGAGRDAEESNELVRLGQLNGYQPKLVNQTNIKSVNGQSLLGSGNLTVESGGVSLITEEEFSEMFR